MDIERLLELLKGHKVRFIIIGATAFPVHGYSRATLDVDIFIEPRATNAERTRRALGLFGYDVTDISIEDLLTKKVLIRQYIVETDIHPFVKGVTFERVWSHKVKARLGKTFVTPVEAGVQESHHHFRLAVEPPTTPLENIFLASNQGQDGIMAVLAAEGRGNGGVSINRAASWQRWK